MVNGLLVVVVQPVLAKRINTLGFPAAVAVSFALFAGGLLLISLGEVVLFLKNELEALRYSPDRPGAVFGLQRLATGIGAFTSAAAGGWFCRRATDSADADSRFWFYCAVQAAIGGLIALAVSLLLRRDNLPAAEASPVGADEAVERRRHDELP